MIPINAQAIVDAKIKGMKPDELILVSMIGKIGEQNHTVYASDKREYEWSWARGLQICVYATSGIKWESAARAIIEAKAEYVSIWDAGRSQGAELWLQPAFQTIGKPKDKWRWDMQYMPWTPEQNWRFLCN